MFRIEATLSGRVENNELGERYPAIMSLNFQAVTALEVYEVLKFNIEKVAGQIDSRPKLDLLIIEINKQATLADPVDAAEKTTPVERRITRQAAPLGSHPGPVLMGGHLRADTTEQILDAVDGLLGSLPSLPKGEAIEEKPAPKRRGRPPGSGRKPRQEEVKPRI